MSYLLFTPRYTRALIDIGYRDADRRIDEIEEFLYSSSGNGNFPSTAMPGLKLGTAAGKRPLRALE